MYTAQGKIDQDELIKQHLPAVRRQALALQVKLPSGVELDDLIQAGTLGLLDATRRFDPAAGVTFGTFASQRIRGAMIDELRTRDWLPRSVRRKAREMDACVRRLEQRHGRAPEEREIAAEMGIGIGKYHELLADTNNGYLLPFEDVVAERGEPEDDGDAAASPMGRLLDTEHRERLKAAIEALPEREKLMITLYYQEDLNLKEIGAVMGVSESRVCQLHSQAVSRMRARLAAD
ncbi:MAG TPA: RNA polymerase sigma factor FliA [Rhodanobacteraceae bacterium]|nr:RNA polymerase sigma factor FliA [Rhodanobacteraceae bacterium]